MSSPLRALWARAGAARASDAPVPSDEVLIEGIRGADPALSAVFYDRLFPTVDRTLYRILGRRESDHDDLVQAAFEQIILTLARGSFAGACSLRTWAASVTTRIATNALRARRRERRVIDRTVLLHEDLRAAPQDLEEVVAARSAIERIRVELAGLRRGRAEAVLLHDVLGQDLAEIAVTTGVSLAAAQSRLVRGRRDLHRRFEQARVGREK